MGYILIYSTFPALALRIISKIEPRAYIPRIEAFAGILQQKSSCEMEDLEPQSVSGNGTVSQPDAQ
jgi:hypothetical protein